MDPTSPHEISGSAGNSPREAPSSPPESIRGVPSERKPSATPSPPNTSAAAPAADAAPVVELHHSRRGSGRTSWLWVALPVAGLLIVPMIGLVYAATSTFGRGEPEPSSSVPLDDGDDLSEPGVGIPGISKAGTKKAKRTTTGSRAGKMSAKPRSDSAAPCCARLHELGKTSPLDVRPAFLSAAAACDAAPDADKALLRAKGNLRATKAEIPEECEP